MAKKEKPAAVETDAINPMEEVARLLGASIAEETESVKQWIDTGSLALNYSCSGRLLGGGIPSGKVIEVFGGSSSCKTLFANNILCGVQKMGGNAFFLDAENTLDKRFASQASGVDTTRLVVIPGEKIPTLQSAFKMIFAIMRNVHKVMGCDKPTVIVYDSIAVSPSIREFEETEDDTTENADKPGERAKICCRELRKLNPLLAKYNTTLVFINQIRDKIGVVYGDKTTTGGGGKSLEFYCSLRFNTNASLKLKDSRENIIGMQVNVHNKKNKVSLPFVSARALQLFFNKGINPLSGLLELLYRTERIHKATSGVYTVDPKYSDGKEYKFRASMDRNEVDMKVLIDCPKLVDAASGEEVQQYIERFQAAVAASANDIASTSSADKEDADD